MLESFYIAVTRNGQPQAKKGNLGVIAGPFGTLEEAQSWLDPARDLVMRQYDPDGRAHFYGYAVVGIKNCVLVGKLNGELGLPTEPPLTWIVYHLVQDQMALLLPREPSPSGLPYWSAYYHIHETNMPRLFASRRDAMDWVEESGFANLQVGEWKGVEHIHTNPYGEMVS